MQQPCKSPGIQKAAVAAKDLALFSRSILPQAPSETLRMLRLCGRLDSVQWFMRLDSMLAV